jgi:hypothetical protein
MESERYAWSAGWFKSDWIYLDADNAQRGAEEWCRNYNKDTAHIKIWRKLIEEVLL